MLRQKLVSVGVNRQNWARGEANEFFSDASNQKMSDASQAMCSHHDQVNVV